MVDTPDMHSRISYTSIIRYIIIHLLLLAGVYIIYALILHEKLIPSQADLLDMDAINYQKIKNFGYSYSENYGSLVAFFPGFPYLWKYTGLGIYGISILNGLMFLTGFVFLCRHFANSKTEIFIFLSLPSIFFMFVPFSEALFFVPSVVLLIGLLKRLNWLIIIGLFLCTITRSAANIFLPAIIITELLVSNNPSKLKNILLYSLPILSGIFLVAWMQYEQTGQWLGFLTTQKYWGVALRMPSLPFRTWGKMDYLDGATLLTGIIITIFTCYIILRFILKKERRNNKAVLFSILYVSGLTIFTIAFKGGALFSFNRYIIPTAFFFVAYSYLIRQKSFTYKEVAIIFLLIFVFWLPFFYSFVHILVITGFFVLTIYLCLYLLLNHKNLITRNISFYLLYFVNLIIQAFLIFKFTGHFWVG